MITYGGEKVTVQAGAPSIHSIGASLGRVARFCGHTKHYYTVLGHSLTVAELMPPQFGIYGLLHDAPESLVGDVPTPMKTQVARNRETVLLRNIYVANGLPWPIPEEAQEAVDEADHIALIAEAHILKHPGAEAQWGTEYDELAAALTKKHMKKMNEWVFDPDKAGRLYVKKFKHHCSQAGLDAIDVWS